MRLAAAIAVLTLIAVPSIAAEYKDVPKEHWAAESVQMVTDSGIMKGYPDATFKGDKPVTRYELAVALQGMVQFLEQSRKPIEKDKAPGSTDAAPKPVSTRKEHWGKVATEFLLKGEYIPKDSPLLQDGEKRVTPTELSQALASVAKRLIELEIPEGIHED